MENTAPFGEILEEFDKLPLGDQETIRDILSKRIIEQRRNELFAEINEARKEYGDGKCRPVSPEELMTEIVS